jgi:hypothetical protein
VVNRPLHAHMVEQLIIYSKTPNVSSGQDEGLSHDHIFLHKTEDAAPNLMFSVPLESKGQGFASCRLDVSQVPCGEYELVLSCICVDGKGGQRILPVLNTRPKFHIV